MAITNWSDRIVTQHVLQNSCALLGELCGLTFEMNNDLLSREDSFQVKIHINEQVSGSVCANFEVSNCFSDDSQRSCALLGELCGLTFEMNNDLLSREDCFQLKLHINEQVSGSICANFEVSKYFSDDSQIDKQRQQCSGIKTGQSCRQTGKIARDKHENCSLFCGRHFHC